MKYNETVLMLKEKAYENMQQNLMENNLFKVNIYKKIYEILKTDHPFDKIEVEEALQILKDLGYKNSEILDIYKILVLEQE